MDFFVLYEFLRHGLQVNAKTIIKEILEKTQI